MLIRVDWQIVRNVSEDGVASFFRGLLDPEDGGTTLRNDGDYLPVDKL